MAKEKTTPKAKKVPLSEKTKELWQGMPEFNQPDAAPLKNLIVSFARAEDIIEFAKLVGQPITPKTRQIWYPHVPAETAMDRRWSDKKK